MNDADKILKRFEALELKRSEWEGIWQKCSDYVMPRLGQHGRKNDFIYDSTAPLALERFAAALESVLAPRTMKWHSLATGFPELDQDPEVARWLEAVRDILFEHRYAPEANFANQLVEALFSLGCVGTAVIYVDELLGRGLRYQCIPVHEVYLSEDFSGRVDTVFRWYKLTARQAYAEFGEALPAKIKEDAQNETYMDKEYEFIHAVFPRKDSERGGGGSSGAPIASVHVAKAERVVVREKGFYSMPYAVSRYTVTAGEVYGRSPAMNVMPDIIQVNAMNKTILRAAEKMVNPPLLLADDDILNAFSLKAGSLNFGGLDDQGRQRVVPLEIRGQLPIGLEMIEQKRTVINEAFYLNLFQVLVKKPGDQTATEVMERAQEKAQLLAPVMGRQQSELLGQIIYREVDILNRAEAFPPMPAKLKEWGAPVSLKYETAMAQALSSRAGQAILNAMNAIAGLIQLDPMVAQMVDAQSAARTVWSSAGAPLRTLRSEEDMEALAEQQKEAMAMQQALDQGGQLMQGLEVAAGAEEKMAKAATYAGGVRAGA